MLLRGRRGLTALALLAWLGSWYVGLLAYRAVIALWYDERVSGGDFLSMAFWTALVNACCIPFLYAPLVEWLRQYIQKQHARAIAAVCLAPVAALGPAGLTWAIWSRGGLATLLSAELWLVYVAFTASAVILLPILVMVMNGSP